MNILELIAIVFSLISVWLTSRNNILCWPFGIIGILAFSKIFFDKAEFGNLYLQLFFIAQSIIGWMNWSNKDNIVKNLTRKNVLILSSVTPILVLFISLLTLKSNHYILDTLTTLLSIFGSILLIYKFIEAWYFWIVADILYIFLFYKNGLYTTSILYFIFLILAYIGLKDWLNLKKIKNEVQ